MIITGILTLLTALSFWYVKVILPPSSPHDRLLYPYRFLFPDSPTNAWFLTPAERSIAVRRIKVRGSRAPWKLYFYLDDIITPIGKSNWSRE